jgi:hypothetical protein
MAKVHSSEFPEFQSLQVPIKFYTDDEGRPIIVSGARRVRALKALAAAGMPGFTADMSILAKEVSRPRDNQ